MDPFDRPGGAAREVGNAALRRMTAAGMTPTQIRRLSKATPDALEVAGIRRRGNPTQTNWAVQNRMADDEKRQTAYAKNMVVGNAGRTDGPWRDLAAKVIGNPKMPRAR